MGTYALAYGIPISTILERWYAGATTIGSALCGSDGFISVAIGLAAATCWLWLCCAWTDFVSKTL